MVHAFKINDYFYLFDVESNNLFRVDELAVSIVKGENLEKFSLQEIDEAKRELEELKNNGLLFTKSSNDLDIEKSRYFKIRFTNLKTQLRHKVAVIVKSILKATRN